MLNKFATKKNADYAATNKIFFLTIYFNIIKMFHHTISLTVFINYGHIYVGYVYWLRKAQ